MDNNFLRRNQRASCMKKTLQMMLILLVCAWLLYQINQSSRANRTERFFGGEITILEEHGIILLGRKVMIPPSWLLNQIPVPDSQKMQENHGNYSENDVQINETDRFYRFHDENGVPPEGNEETEHYYGNNDSGFSFGKEMNTDEAIIFSGDVEDDSESNVTLSGTSGIRAGYSSVL